MRHTINHIVCAAILILLVCVVPSSSQPTYPQYNNTYPANALSEVFSDTLSTIITRYSSSQTIFTVRGTVDVQTGPQKISQTYFRYNVLAAYYGKGCASNYGNYWLTATGSGGTPPYYMNINGGCPGGAGTGWETDSKGMWTRYGTYAQGNARHQFFLDRPHGALGMQNNYILNTQLTASSTLDFSRNVSNSRIDFDYSSWTPAVTDLAPYVELDLGMNMTIYGAGSQGAPDRDEWVTSLRFSYRADGTTAAAFVDSAIYAANTDCNTTVSYIFPSLIVARYIRVKPLTWNTAASLRFEIYGRQLYGKTPVGISFNAVNQLPDSSFSASSYSDTSNTPWAGRLNSINGYAWQNCMGSCTLFPTDSVQPWIQVDLLTTYTLTGISTQEPPGTTNNRVYTYYVASSNDGVTFTKYGYPNPSVPYLFTGNVLKGIKTNWFNTTITARYLRVIVNTYTGTAYMRMELYGEPVAPSGALLPGPFAWSDYTVSFRAQTTGRGYIGMSFRHQDMYNWYEFRMRIGQRANLTRDTGTYAVAYTGNAGTPSADPANKLCTAHGITSKAEACAIDGNYTTYTTMASGINKPHLQIQFPGYFQITKVRVTTGPIDYSGQAILEVYIMDSPYTWEVPKVCGDAPYAFAAAPFTAVDFNCFNRSGSYVYVGLINSAQLSVAEIEVFGPDIKSSRSLLKRVNGVFTMLAQDSVEVTRNSNLDYSVVAVGNLLKVYSSASATVPVFAVNDNSLYHGTIAPTFGESGGGRIYNMYVQFNTQNLTMNVSKTAQPLRPIQWSHYKQQLSMPQAYDALSIQVIATTGCCLHVYSRMNLPPVDYNYDFNLVTTDVFTTVIYPQPGAGQIYVGVFNGHQTNDAVFDIKITTISATTILPGFTYPSESLSDRLSYRFYKLNLTASWTYLTVVFTPQYPLVPNVLRILYKMDAFAVEGQYDAVEPQAASLTYTRVVYNPTPDDIWYWGVRITNTSYTSAGYSVKVIPPDPVITSIDRPDSPTVGGVVVTLTGTDFSDSGRVTIDGRNATIVSWSSTVIVLLTPVGEGRSVSIYVITKLNQISNAFPCTYLSPTLDSISPTSGPTVGGIIITLNGNNFGLNPVITVSSSYFSPKNCTRYGAINAGHSQMFCILPSGVGASASFQVATPAGASVSRNFDYNVPVILTMTPNTSPTAGGILVTLQGSNFGSSIATITLGPLTIAAASVSFWNDSVIIFTNPPFQGVDLSVALSVGGQASVAATDSNNAFVNLFSYGSPILYDLWPKVATTKGYSLGGVVLTITGANFGLNLNSGLNVLVGSSPCPIISNNHTVLFCKLAQGDGKNLNVKVNVATLYSLTTLVYSYLPPSIAYYSPVTIAAASSDVLTLTGDDFGFNPTVTINGAPCSVISGSNNHTALKCIVPDDIDVNNQIQVTANLQQSNILLINRTAPSIFSIQPQNLTTSGPPQVITLTGLNFGSGGVGTVSIDGQPCVISSAANQYADTFIRCTLPAGQGAYLNAIVTVGSQASPPQPYSYAPPTIISLTPLISPAEGGNVLTIVGTSFGKTDAQVTIDGSSCPVTTNGQQHTQIRCTVPPQAINRPGSFLMLQVSISGQIAQTTNFSYASPKITDINPTSSLTNGLGLITVTGTSFTQSGSVYVNGVGCAIGAPGTSYSSTSIVCVIPEGTGTGFVQVITGVESLASNKVAFTYIKPTVTLVDPKVNLPTAGGILITITGSSFGASVVTGVVTVAGSVCTIGGAGTSWSHQQIICTLPAGLGASQPLLVNVSGLMSTSYALTYAAPIISYSLPPNGPTAGGALITIIGLYFSTQQGSALFGAVYSSSIVFQNETQIVATLPSGTAGNVNLQVTVAGQSSNIIQFSYDGPLVTSVFPMNGTTEGGIPIVIQGLNFLPSPKVYFGSVLATQLFTNDSYIIVALPSGQGLNIQLRVATQLETASSAAVSFNYNKPVISDVQYTTVYSSGPPQRITLIGANFGTSNTITLNGAVCAAAGAGARHNTSVCTLPVGAGANVPLIVKVSEQTSDPFLFSYAPPNVTSVVPNTGPTIARNSDNSVYVLTLTGTSFGLDGSVTVGGKSCPIYRFISSHSTIQCELPEGQGTGNLVTVTSTSRTSTQLVYFDYYPPAIDSASPTTGPTTGAPTILVLIGSGFGADTRQADTTVTVGGNVCAYTSFGLSQTRIQCVVPEGEGINLPILVNTSGQLSTATPVSFSYSPMGPITINPPSAPTNGGTNITISGTNFGLTPSVTIGTIFDTRPCVIVARNHTQIICSTPAGVGTGLTLTVTAKGASTNVQTASFSYNPPVITALSGCVDDPATGGTHDCPVLGNISLTIFGFNFGRITDSAVVSVAGYQCESTPAHDPVTPHEILTCTVGAGVGVNRPVVLTVGGQSTEALLFSYSNPEIDSFSLSVNSGPLTTAGQVNSTAGGDTLSFTGKYFGSDVSHVVVKYGPAGALWTDSTNFLCSPIDPSSFSDGYIECQMAPGVGANLHLWVEVTLQLPLGLSHTITTFKQYSGMDTDTISYPTPVIVAGTISSVGGTPSHALQGTIQGGQDIEFDCMYIGTQASQLTVMFGLVGGPYDQACTAPSIIVADTRLRCRTAARVGEEGPYVFVVTANGATSLPGNDTYSYPADPSLTSVTGCTQSGNTAVDCPTAGGQLLVMTGDKFTQTDLSVKVGVYDCANVTYVSIKELNCVLPAGIGLNVLVVITAGTRTSVPKPYVSYAIAVLANITGCTDTASVHGAAGTLTTVDCPRTGNKTVTITGTNLGSVQKALVFISGQSCTNVVHDSKIPDSKLTCTIPTGTALEQGVILVQGGGQLSANQLFISYTQCIAGYYALPGQLTCLPCAAGSYSPVSGQYSCTPCSSGSFAAVTGRSLCDLCPSGFYSKFVSGSVIGPTNCTACDPGYYAFGTGKDSCLPCDAGSYNNVLDVSGGRAICYSCPIGTASSASAATSCGNCTAGRYTSSKGSVVCSDCSSGTYQPYDGRSGCSACSPGTANPFNQRDRCDDCPMGYSQQAYGQASCQACPSGYMSNTTGLTNCYECPVGQVSQQQSNGDGAYSCTTCTAGTFVGATGQAACITCDKGTYSNTAGASACTNCLRGTFAGSSGSTTCTNCTAGRFASGTGTVDCSVCTPGFFAAVGGMSACTACPIGSVSATTSATSCTPCSPGSAIPTSGQAVCIACASGTYADSYSTGTCSPCAAGRFSQYQIGALVGPTNCTDCAIGYFASGSQQASCTPCDVGTYAPTNGSTACISCAKGSAQSQSGQGSCVNCTSGYYASSTGQFACAVCEAGTSQSASSASTCSACAPGRAQLNSNKADCDDCAIGKFTSSSGQVTCLDCPAGTYSNTTGQSFCYNCAKGSVQPTAGLDRCVACDAGSYIDSEGQAVCIDCPAGKYGPTTGLSQCILCTAGKASTQLRSTSCTNCTARYFSPADGYSYCSPCLAGTANNQPGQSSCPPCAAGTQQPNGASATCDSCIPGKYAPSTGTLLCSDCNAGSASAAYGATSCPLCSPGTFTSVAAQTACGNCSIGMATAASGSVGCTPCSPGAYADNTGFPTCTPCVAGKYQPASKSTSCIDAPPGSAVAFNGQAAYTVCSAGTYSTGGSLTCTACDAGYHSTTPAPGLGATGCAPCDKGYANAASGQASCSPCPVGTYGNDTTMLNCLPCTPGSYSNAAASTTCTQCELGKATNSYNALTCSNCAAGTYSGVAKGATVCVPCDVGTAQPNPASTQCNPCGAGRFASQSGQASCKDCPSGQYSNLTSNANCAQCLPGSYQASQGMSYCDLCDSGSVMPSYGSPVCVQCDAGFFAPTTGLASCTPCTEGTYSVKRSALPFDLGAIACTACTAGTYQDSTGQALCKECASGSHSSNPNAVTCDLCPPGFAQPLTGQPECDSCLAGKYAALDGTVSCSECPGGTFAAAPEATKCDPCGPGTYFATTGAVQCTQCETGRFNQANRQLACVDCLVGTYTNSTQTITCDDCGAGQYQDSVGKTSCIVCPLGRYMSGAHASICTACSPGSYANVTGLTECFPCAPGTAQPENGQSSCAQCELGKANSAFSQKECSLCAAGKVANVNGSSACTDCPAGSSQPSRGSSECIPCDAGKVQLVPGQATCDLCSPGSFSNTSSAITCTPCETGKYQSDSGKTNCTFCPFGTYSIQPGGVSCLNCPAGTFSASLGAYQCKECAAGSYQASEGKSVCFYCTAGFYQDSPGQVQCKFCKAGTYSNRNATLSCDLCSVGRYQDEPQSVACKDCQQGRYTEVNGTTGCLECAVGTFASELASTRCDKCPEGTYQDLTYQSTCKNCTAGHFMDIPGAQVCKLCPAGRATNTNHSTVCPACGGGTYQPTPGESTCILCPRGTYSVRDSGGATVCTPCEQGKFNNMEGAFNCLPCPVGTAQIFERSSACTECTAGTYSNAEGLSSCLSCERGKFANDTAQTTCSLCDEGNYQSDLGQTQCIPCDLGQYSETEGVSNCLACKAGLFAPVLASKTCTVCPPGSAQPSRAAWDCNICDPGTYAATNSSTSCKPCKVGTYTNSSGSTECFPCPAGTYQNNVGATDCKPCERGRYSDSPGAEVCQQCLVGQYSNDVGQSKCDQCDAGKYQQSEGQTFCVSCSPGRSSQMGQSICPACAVGSASYKYGSSECKPCDSTQTSNFDRTQCQCDEGYYQPASSPLDENIFQCLPCPAGADCTQAGTTESKLAALSGWWRATNVTLNFYRCQIRSYCAGGEAQSAEFSETSGTGCNNDRVGIMCSYCQEGYRVGPDNNCTPCPSGASSYIVSLVIFAFFILVVWLQIYIILASGKELMNNAVKQDEDDVTIDISRAESEVGKKGKVKGGSSSDSDEDEDGSDADSSSDDDSDSDSSVDSEASDRSDSASHSGDKSSSDSGDEDNRATERLYQEFENPDVTKLTVHGPPAPDADFTYQLKIFVTFLQVVFTVGTGTNIILPSTFKSFLLYFDFVMFSSIASAATSSDCFSFIDYYGKYLMVVLVPVVMLILMIVFFLVPHYLQCLCFRHSTMQQRVRSKMRFWKLFLYLLFLIYPAVSSTVLGHYVCQRIDDRSYILSDMRQECYTHRWWTFAYLGIMLSVLYPIGIPTFFFVLLRTNLDQLHDVRVRAQLGFLYSGYHHKMWFFELIDSTHKIFLCSIIPFFTADAQMPIAIAWAGSYLSFLLWVNPYSRVNDDRLHLLAQTEIVLVLLAAHLFNSFPTSAAYNTTDDVVMSIALIVVVCGAFVLFIGFGVVMMGGKFRKWYERWSKRRQAAKDKQAAADGKNKGLSSDKSGKDAPADVESEADQLPSPSRDNLGLNTLGTGTRVVKVNPNPGAAVASVKSPSRGMQLPPIEKRAVPTASDDDNAAAEPSVSSSNADAAESSSAASSSDEESQSRIEEHF